MRILLQRVSKGQVKIADQTVAQIDKGLVLLLGIHKTDQVKDADYLIEKCLNLRIFSDSDDKMNLSVIDIAGEVLLVSQFTLYADTRKGRRPGFSDSARPEVAIPLYEYVIQQIKLKMGKVETGQFGADMQVDLVNDGPVTIMIDSEDKYPKIGLDDGKL
ncbi:MAG: D-tyrosyl-tRNA(Tyr) deacylase [Lentisphaeria bacterium]|nr:D-tyrosyl-tRNA(Tyr) deacylase [Lentisphaeria bacterium]